MSRRNNSPGMSAAMFGATFSSGARTPVAKDTRTPAAVIAARKAHLTAQLAELQRQIDAVPADGSWAQAGDLAHFEETLAQLIRPQ